MGVIGRSNILHLVDAATLITALIWSAPRYLKLNQYDVASGEGAHSNVLRPNGQRGSLPDSLCSRIEFLHLLI